MKNYKNINDYISNYPKDVQVLLEKMRIRIKKSAPQAEETITYGIPTFTLNGNLVHFGAFKNHISFFPTSSGISAFKKELSAYVISKGTIQFPLDKPLPLSLITKIVKFRIKENMERNTKGEFPKISAPASRALQNAKIKNLKDLSRWTEKEILELHGMGPSTIPQLKKALKAKGLSFK